MIDSSLLSIRSGKGIIQRTFNTGESTRDHKACLSFTLPLHRHKQNSEEQWYDQEIAMIRSTPNDTNEVIVGDTNAVQ